MTTSRPARKPAERRAAGQVPGDGAPRTAPQADADAGPPDDIQELREEIEQTREQLGETVEQLAAKADVKARARNKAAELTGRVKDKTSQARIHAAARVGSAHDHLASKTGGTTQRAMSVGSEAKEQLSGRVRAAAAPVWEAMPEGVQQAVAKGASSARQRRAPLAVAAGALISGCLAVRWWRKR
jgi:hypothetical protein